MPSRFISPFPDVGNGISPSDGAKYTFFESGTSTLKNTFSDQALTTKNANPVISDSDGVFPTIYIEGTYKVRLEDKNNVQAREADPVSSVGEGTDIVTISTASNRTTATSGQTAFTVPSGYVTGIGNLAVFIDGVRLKVTTEFTETSGTTFTLVTPALVGQLVDSYVGSSQTSSTFPATNVVYVDADLVTSDVQTALRAVEANDTNFTDVKKDFGAVGDGVTDDTAAFNLFTAAIRAAVDDFGGAATATDTVDLSFLIPPGNYVVSSVDLTELRTARNVTIIGYGAVLIGNTAGKVILDCIGSRWLWIVGLTIVSPTTAVAKHGIQIGPSADAQANGNNKLQFVQCLGEYSLSSYANYGSETTQLYSCRFSNESITTASYAAYMDGEGLLLPTSDYATITRTAVPVSFTNNSHYGCQFRQLGGGSSVFTARTSGWVFDDACYFLAFDEANVIIYLTTTSRQIDMNLNGLFETSQSPGVKDCIRFTGDASNTNLKGFKFAPTQLACEDFVFNNTTGANVTITECNITINSVTDPGATLKLVNTTSGISIIGDYKSRIGAVNNFPDLTLLGGNIFLEDKSLVTIPASTYGFVFDQAGGGVDAHNMTVIP